MPVIIYKSSDYPSKLGKGYLSFSPEHYYVSWADIVHATITVGRASRFFIFNYGVYSYFDIIYRTAMIFANLRSFADFAPLLKTDVYKNLDPSEKSAISYFLGLTFAKLSCSDFLSVQWLMHLDVYNGLYPYDLWKGKKRPDLFGLNQKREWIVFESKGRTGKFDKKAFEDAKKQTRNIKKIDNTYPAVRAAAEVFFQGDRLGFRIEDPPEFDNDAPDLEISENQIFKDYYEPFISLLRAKTPDVESINGIEFSFINIEEVDIRVGIATEIIRTYKESTFDRLYSFWGRLSEITNIPPNYKIGLDGIVVQLGKKWSEFEMAKEPNDRMTH